MDGDLYGTTYGSTLQGGNPGTVFKITPGGALTTLYSFCAQTGCVDGANPNSGLVQATNGYLFGTTGHGGANPGPLANGGGTIFKISPSGKLTTLYSFCVQNSCADGVFPNESLVQAANGDLYGTTAEGGASNVGTLFKITPGGVFKTLYSFCTVGACDDGQYPNGALIQAGNGDLYGTTFESGVSNAGYYRAGSVFEFSIRTGTLTTLYRFCANDITCGDGAYPGPLVQANNGDFYGSTQSGGANMAQFPPGQAGTIFRINSSGSLSSLYNFCGKPNCADGNYPSGSLLQATDENLYGITAYGGVNGNVGTVFKLSSTGLKTLHTFCSQSGCPDGQLPFSSLLQATDGNLYGTTTEYGANPGPDGWSGGTVFRISLGLAPFVKMQPRIGIAGETLEILGTNLSGATSVTLNGTPVSFTVKSGSLIIATVPAGATTGTIQVVTPAGTLESNVPFEVSH